MSSIGALIPMLILMRRRYCEGNLSQDPARCFCAFVIALWTISIVSGGSSSFPSTCWSVWKQWVHAGWGGGDCIDAELLLHHCWCDFTPFLLCSARLVEWSRALTKQGCQETLSFHNNAVMRHVGSPYTTGHNGILLTNAKRSQLQYPWCAVPEPRALPRRPHSSLLVKYLKPLAARRSAFSCFLMCHGSLVVMLVTKKQPGLRQW